MTRDELLAVNLQMITDVAARVRQSAPDAFHILACNPLEAMLTAYHRHSGLPRSRVVGMAGVLDSARFRAFVALELGCSAADVQAMVIGSHGPEMVPLPRLATVAGMPLTQLLPAATIEGIVRRTQEAGTEILNLQRNASACCGPAGAALVMAEAYLGGGKRLLPCTAYLDGEYGLSGLFLGVPCWVDDSGISRIEEIELTTEERAMFERSAQVVRSTLAEARL
jgi:malate dehydrogenase